MLLLMLLSAPAAPVVLPEYPGLPITFPYVEIPPDYHTIRTAMEYGYVQTRAKFTVAPRVYEFSHESLTSAERADWLTFWHAQRGGAGTFHFTDPNTAAVVVCRIDESSRTRITRTGPITYTIGPIRLEEAL